MASNALVLRIGILEGRNLASKDSNGLSDPYVVVHVDDASYHTQVINETLNPEWKAEFDHPINSSKPLSPIQVTIWDKDRFGRDYMGEVEVRVSGLLSSQAPGYNSRGNEAKWYPVRNTSHPKSTVSGEILIKLGIMDPHNQFLTDADYSTLWEGISGLTIQSGQEVAAHEGEKPVLHRERSSLAGFVGLVFAEVVRAEDLPPDANVTRTGFDMDPFVVVSFGRNTIRTKVIRHSLNPVWNEKFYFPVKDHETSFDIKCSIYDWDKFSSNDYYGSAFLPVSLLIQEALENEGNNKGHDGVEHGMREHILDIKLKNDKWYGKYQPKLYLRMKFIKYEQLRRQFWHALAKNYDSDENNLMNHIEIATMLDSLGSSLSQQTIDGFFTRFGKRSDTDELTFDELVDRLEEHLSKQIRVASTDGEENDSEHLVFVKECPICHKPNLSQYGEADIITHIAICASNDWNAVDTFVVGDFVTESQAQRKWLAKVIAKVGYGGYKVGANNANIIVQDRRTGQLIEEKMATYVRLGIRLLYKGLKSSRVETKTIRNLLENLSVNQGKKYNNPASAKDIPHFIKFHKLDVTEILDPLPSFKNFNEFFYRKLNPAARKVSSPDDPRVLVSPADCRMMAFNTIEDATRVWIKGQNFSLERLFGGDMEMAREFEGGRLGIFRLAPQDYHRFHIPVEGVISKPKHIPGAYYTVNPMAIRSALDVYGENKRCVTIINSPHFGKVAYVMVGAMMVGSIVLTSTPNDYVKRMDEHGYFAFGGSTIVLLFQKGQMEWDADILENAEQSLETLVRVGMNVGRSTKEMK